MVPAGPSPTNRRSESGTIPEISVGRADPRDRQQPANAVRQEDVLDYRDYQTRSTVTGVIASTAPTREEPPKAIEHRSPTVSWVQCVVRSGQRLEHASDASPRWADLRPLVGSEDVKRCRNGWLHAVHVS